MPPWLQEELCALARRRNRIFAGKKRNRPLGKNYEEVGLRGEWEFACFSGIMPKLMVGGDGGVDFEIPVVFTVDVKTSRKGDALLVEAGKVKADIYVLAHYVEADEASGEERTLGDAHLLGWTFAANVKSVEPCDTGRGVINHRIPVEKLRSMDDLAKMMGKIRRE